MRILSTGFGRPLAGRAVLAAVLLVLAAERARGVVINEIMFHAPGNDIELEYLELYNESPNLRDLSGWFFREGLTYTFPEGTILPGYDYLVVCKNPQAARAFYDVDPAKVYGGYEGRLENAGERITLMAWDGTIPRQAMAIVAATVRYNDRGRWPETTDGTGHSLSLIDPYTDSEKYSSWAPSLLMGGTPGAPNGFSASAYDVDIIRVRDTWRFFRGTEEPPATWNTRTFIDSSWESGPSGFGYSNNPAELTRVNTTLDDMGGGSGYLSVFLRRTFDVGDPAEIDRLILIVEVDDGFVGYLNGVEVARINVPGAVGEPVPIDRDADDAPEPFEQEYDITAYKGVLVAGQNVLAIQGVNTSLTSSDMVMVPRLVRRRVIAGGESGDAIVFNEMLSNTSGEPFVELYNRSGAPVNLGGAYLSDDRMNLTKLRIPDGTTVPGRGLLVFTQTDLAGTGIVLDPAGVYLILTAASRDRVITAHHFEVESAEISRGRYPDGGREWYAMESPSPGDPNTLSLIEDLVINEIMYHPMSDNINQEYLELHNRGVLDIDLEGFRLSGGVDYTFPEGAVAPANGYVVVAKNPDLIKDQYGLSVVWGPFEGGATEGFLSDRGETLRLRDALGNVIDEVTYAEGGMWPVWADGGGSSLELKDPFQDNANPSAWGASDEASKAQWQSFEYTGIHVTFKGRNEPELQIMTLHRGECLLDDIEMRRGGTTQNIITNGGFENGLNNWYVLGTHVGSHVINEPGNPSNRVLLVVAEKKGDTGPNKVKQRTTTSLVANQSYRINFRAKWQRGIDLILFRTIGSGIQWTFRMPVPIRLGSPGAQNSIFTATLGPAIGRVTQDPILPTSGQTVRVFAQIQDADGVGAVTAFYKRDEETVFRSVPMNDGGAGGDDLAGDGIYTGTLPAQSNGTIEFFIEAEDALGATSRFPRVPDFSPAPGDPEATALYRVGLSTHTTLRTYNLIMTAENLSGANGYPRLSNHLWDGTLVFDNREVFYNCGVRRRGSPWWRPNAGWRVEVPRDQPVGGLYRQLNIDSRQNDGAQQRERMTTELHRRLDTPGYRLDYVSLRVNAGDQGIHEQGEKVDDDFISRWFEGDDDGALYKANAQHEYFGNSDTGDCGNRDFIWANFTYRSPGDKEAYRWYWRPRSNYHNDDFYGFLRAINILDTGRTPNATVFDREVESVVNVDEFLRHLVVCYYVWDWDTVGVNNGQNAYIYIPGKDGRVWFLTWDDDHTWSGNDRLTVNSTFPSLLRMVNRPQYLHRYWGYMVHLAEGPASRAAITALVNDHARVNGRGGSDLLTFTDSRLARVRSEYPKANFDITTADGQSATGGVIATERTTIEVLGTGPVTTDVIDVNGSLLQPLWTNATRWKVFYTLPRVGENILNFRAIDYGGYEVGQDTITVLMGGDPVILSVTPSEGTIEGRADVALRGHRFAEDIQVYFNGSEATDIRWESASVVRVVTPPGDLGPAEVRVENPGDGSFSSSELFTYVEPRPVLTSIDPVRGPAMGGDWVTIAGKYFLPDIEVYFGTWRAEADWLSDELILATSPSGGGTVDVCVTNVKYGLTGCLDDAYTFDAPIFIRGDVSGDRRVDLTDVIGILRVIFASYYPACMDAADVDDNGQVEPRDALILLDFVFGGPNRPDDPFPDPGPDLTVDGLYCTDG